jgi:hypothetical protein
MVATFNTTGAGAPATTGKNGNTLMIVLGLAVAGFLVYRFVLKPRMDANKNKQEKTQ